MRGTIRIDRNPQRKGPNILADAHYIPLRDKIVTATLCNSVFEHLISPYKGLLEMTRVSKKYIRLLIPNVHYFKRILRALLNPGFKAPPGTLHLQAWDLLAMKFLVQQVEGLEILGVAWTRYGGARARWPSLLFGRKMIVTMGVAL